jgi:hypothetical protein
VRTHRGWSALLLSSKDSLVPYSYECYVALLPVLSPLCLANPLAWARAQAEYLTCIAGPKAMEGVLSRLNAGIALCQECMGRGFAPVNGGAKGVSFTRGFAPSEGDAHHDTSPYQDAYQESVPGEFDDRGVGGQRPVTSYV